MGIPIVEDLFGSGGNVQMPDPKDYLPLVQQSADINRLDQTTPFGSTTFVQPEQEQPLSFDLWSQGQPTNTVRQVNPFATDTEDQYHMVSQAPTQAGYNQYVTDFNENLPVVQPTVTQELSPQLQNLFNMQFDPNAYTQYGDDYMANARSRLDPIFDRQQERFAQSMANRGQPVGSEYYSDAFGDLSDAQNRSYQDAAFQATQLGEQARLQDFNRLMSAMGGSQVAYPGVDTMGAANMAMNADLANLQTQNQATNNLWNTIGGLGSAYVTGSLLNPG